MTTQKPKGFFDFNILDWLVWSTVAIILISLVVFG